MSLETVLISIAVAFVLGAVAMEVFHTRHAVAAAALDARVTAIEQGNIRTALLGASAPLLPVQTAPATVAPLVPPVDAAPTSALAKT